MRPLALFFHLLLLPALLGGCSRVSSTPQPPVPAADAAPHGLYDASTGQATSLPAVVSSLANVDLLALGELHFHSVGSEVELEILKGMLEQDRPLALAMEFFERDHQPALDAYLAGDMDEATFREKTGRKEAYDTSHRPLVELCKANGVPIIAANTPRRLVKAYRKSKMTYEEFVASLPEADRALLPRATSLPTGEFHDRFMKTMGPDRGPRFLASMALWNDTMVESMADFRAQHPQHRILFIVGVFHVEGGLGAITKYRATRPDDRIQILAMVAHDDGDVSLRPEDRNAGDVVLELRSQ